MKVAKGASAPYLDNWAKGSEPSCNLDRYAIKMDSAERSAAPTSDPITPRTTSDFDIALGMSSLNLALRSAALKNNLNAAIASTAASWALRSSASSEAKSAWKCSEVISMSASQLPSRAFGEKSLGVRV